MKSIKYLTARVASLNFRQVFYIIAGLAVLIFAIDSKDFFIGIISISFLYQGIFNTCLFGSCRVRERKNWREKYGSRYV